MKFRVSIAAVLTLWLTGCVVFQPAPQPIVKVVGLTPLPSEGLELRFNLKLRVQNPRDETIRFDGVSVSLDLDNQGLATGVSAQTGEVTRFGEAVIEVPMSVSAFTALRQAIRQLGQSKQPPATRDLPYALSGRLSSTGFNDVLFSSHGTLSGLDRAGRSK